jgi:pimeloyl-ACP methyl ester carboxylesterase
MRGLMKNIILVHGGWSGGWQWSSLAPILRDFGHNVYTPTLSGLGDRSHLAHPGIDVNTHITDIVNLISYYRLRSVHLLGFSYGGLVVTGAANAIPDCIEQLIYLDAFVPRDGETFADIVGDRITRQFKKFAEGGGDGWKIHPFKPDDERLTPQPIKTALTPVRFAHPKALELPRSYIACTGKDPEWSFTGILARIAEQSRSDGFRYRELETGHFPMISDPSMLAEVLNEFFEEEMQWVF